MAVAVGLRTTPPSIFLSWLGETNGLSWQGGGGGKRESDGLPRHRSMPSYRTKIVRGKNNLRPVLGVFLGRGHHRRRLQPGRITHQEVATQRRKQTDWSRLRQDAGPPRPVETRWLHQVPHT